jgi:hypothetical protein
MATNNNQVTVMAGLVNGLLTSPPIGTSLISGSEAFVDGALAADTYVNVTATGAPGTALHPDLTADYFGKVMVSVPSGGQKVTVWSGSTKIGTVQPGLAYVFPVDSGVILKGTVVSGTQMVGVTYMVSAANV